MVFKEYIRDHEELYQKLDFFLLEFTKLKNKRDDEFLIELSKPFYEYIEALLAKHFKDEEEKLFPSLKDKVDPEILLKIICDHDEIREKFKELKANMKAFQEDRDLDCKTQVLFLSYNLIATINHHAQREDLHIFNNQALLG